MALRLRAQGDKRRAGIFSPPGMVFSSKEQRASVLGRPRGRRWSLGGRDRDSLVLQFVVDDLLEPVERLRAAQEAAVDEERRRARDTVARSVLLILVDLRLRLT